MSAKLIKSKLNINGVFKLNNETFYVGAKITAHKKAGINIYDLKSSKLIKFIEFPKDTACGEMYNLEISGIDVTDKKYRIVSDDTEYVDKFATKIIGNEIYGKKVSVNDLYGGFSELKLSETAPLHIPYDETVMYLSHVRAMTMDDKLMKEGKGTFIGLTKKINYLKSLGINSLELMPVNEYIENPSMEDMTTDEKALRYRQKESDEKKLINFWGFDSAYHRAIKSSYGCEDSETEFETLVKSLHKNGIECILMMYFKDGSDTDYVCDSLVYMVRRFGVDGFRILGENIDLKAVIANPYLKHTKIMCDMDVNITEENRDKRLLLYNDRFMNMARRILKSDEDLVPSISYALRENYKNISVARYVSDYFGFTLNDLVSYNKKHNEDNLENNTDGASYNYSWNCGEEGETKKRNIMALRKRQARNAMLLMMTAQGVPVIRGGDEMLNSQKGNNNPYCQDNEIGWINYEHKAVNKEFLEFTKNLIAFRKRHKILHQTFPLRMSDYISCKMADISYHGEEPFRMNQDVDSREWAVMYEGAYAKCYTGEKEPTLMIIYNLHWEDRDFSLYKSAKNKNWKLIYSSDGSTDESFDEKKALKISSDKFHAMGRSISVLMLDQ